MHASDSGEPMASACKSINAAAVRQDDVRAPITLLAGLSAAALLSQSRSAAACQCSPIRDGDALANADVGFRGRVLSFEPFTELGECEAIDEKRKTVTKGGGCVRGSVRYRHRRGCTRRATPRVEVRSGSNRHQVEVGANGLFEVCGLSGPVDIRINNIGDLDGTSVATTVAADEIVELHPVLPSTRAFKARFAVLEQRKGVDSRFPIEVATKFRFCSFGKRFEVGREYDVWAWKDDHGTLWTHACAVRDVGTGPKFGSGCAGCTSGSPGGGALAAFFGLLGLLATSRRRRRRRGSQPNVRIAVSALKTPSLI